jgi:hypothetical protein
MSKLRKNIKIVLKTAIEEEWVTNFFYTLNNDFILVGCTIIQWPMLGGVKSDRRARGKLVLH